MTANAILLESSRLYLWITIVLTATLAAVSVGTAPHVGLAIGFSLSLIASAGFLFNDAIDFKIDAMNQMGRLSRATPETRARAYLLAALLGLTGIASAAILYNVSILVNTIAVLAGAVDEQKTILTASPFKNDCAHFPISAVFELGSNG